MKQKTVFVCQSCGEQYPKWTGRCQACGEWNTLEEEKKVPEPAKNAGGATRAAARLREGLTEGGQRPSRGFSLNPRPSKVIPITQIDPMAESRSYTRLDEFDRILGGGIVAGAATLVGGEPGIGKSTLLLQVAQRLASVERPSLYVSGEESLEQMRLRASRMEALSDQLLCVTETQVESIGDHITQVMPSCVIVDSIQTVYSPEVAGAPGSISQIREGAAHLVFLCKQLHIPLFLIGHVTKSGVVAGPRILEHMVDTVLYFEGDRHHNFRILRAVKNRFGSTNEIGIFEMVREGLREVKNPSELFLQERPDGASGSVVVPVLEGTRPLLVEIQALAAPNGGFGSARRSASGLDIRRVNLLIAVLEKRLGMRMFDQDVYVNIAGGAKVEEPAADLATLCAIVSSYRNVPVEPGTVIIGEVGLAGEIRSVSHLDKRLAEAARLGFTKAVTARLHRKKAPATLRVLPAANVAEALGHLGL